ncbi:TauD/TfdA dioxygenase family protein [Pseudohalioglobus lutimaris]|uniref:TauD/TfdA family dioxygenase n=1 Tax=Pseudohalioglobus lutimaris TaxID=1737061 RepID=A0A2N5X7Y6_9GAMM|nr:TauD/TfdA family dioxygenase [Pseudohalioglobus lutimaris]PLW70599.1 TauD/TfdA family dioxygenase [Pseudohalioglobus lutimaris]
MSISIDPSGQSCGATLTGVDLATDLSPVDIETIKHALFEHHVICFPGQHLCDSDLERFGGQIGPLGPDPYLGHIDGHEHVVEIVREADENSAIHAEVWHSDWSFLPDPPEVSVLYGITIPDEGGDTLFANQRMALAQMPADLRSKVLELTATHSAKDAYSYQGIYGTEEARKSSSIDIRPSETAMETEPHPLVMNHPHTGMQALFGCLGYIIALEDKGYIEGLKLLMELREWQTRDEFIYRHKWQPDMLVMWDNYSVLHRATGGYEGQPRKLHRVTVSTVE